MSDGKETSASAPDHGGIHRDAPTKAVTGGASAKGGPASPDNPKGETIPGYDPSAQPDFAFTKPGSNDGAGLVGKIMGSLSKGGSSSG